MMNARRIVALARRVMRQVLRDRRIVALLVVVPMLVLTLGAILFRSEQASIPLGIVNEDAGLTTPLTGKLVIGQLIVDELGSGDTFELIDVDAGETDGALRDGTVQAVLVLPESFSAEFQKNRQAILDLRLEGSNPSRSMMITARVTEAAMKAVAGLAAAEMGLPGAASAGGEVKLPVTVEATYLYAGPEFDTMDFIAPVYIAFLALFFVFLLACVAFLRERSQGTMERLLATPATRLEVVLGYMLGLGLFALMQVAIILFFTVWVLKIHYLGSLALLFLIVALLAIVGVSMGILASVFARTEFQVIQFIPLLIIPQALLSGLFWPVEEMPGYLQPLAYIMPLTYANRALRDVMLKGWGLAEIWPNLLILSGFAVLFIALGALLTRREVA
ncbi:MAG: ABC transporter permease [Anaerolineae bacterium]|jgi:ABC-2 type transport system permease protein